MIALPPIPEFRARCQALAALDLILCPEWEYRWFSFNSAWAPRRQMASMRNGCGDEWFCLFHPAGWAALKGLDHESSAWAKGREPLSQQLRAAIPPALAEFADEPAFRWEFTSFAFYCLGPAHPWVCVNQQTSFSRLPAGGEQFLALTAGSPADYVRYAAECLERNVDEGRVDAIFRHVPITAEVVAGLNPDLELTSIAQALFDEIGYPAQPGG